MSAPPKARRGSGGAAGGGRARAPRRRGPGPGCDQRILARRQAVARSRARRRRRLLLSGVALLALAAAALAFARSPLFAIGDVRVVGLDGSAAAQVRAAAGIAPGQNLLWADLRAARDRVQGLAWVRAAHLRRVPPSTVTITVEPRIPVAVVRVATGAWLVDADGVVVSGGARETLPTVEAPDSVLPEPGRPVSDTALRSALAVHTRLPADLRVQVDRYEASGQRGLRLHLRPNPTAAAPDGVWVRFGAPERVADKARVLRVLLEQAASANTPALGEIDVRAPDNPVLVPAG